MVGDSRPGPTESERGSMWVHCWPWRRPAASRHFTRRGLCSTTHPDLFGEMNRLGVLGFHRFDETGPGIVDLSMDGSVNDATGSGLSVGEWIGEFLADGARADVLVKLSRSRAAATGGFRAGVDRGEADERDTEVILGVTSRPGSWGRGD